MGRSPCCEKVGLKKGPWTPEEDQKLLAYIDEHGHGSWRALPGKAGLQRCGKSCRLRWTNYLRPDIKRGKFSLQEEQTIIQLHALLGNRWSAIATHLPKRTDNEIKNYWNTHLKKRLAKMGIDPVTHKPRSDALGSGNGQYKSVANLSHMAQWESARLEAEARLVRETKLRAPSSSEPFQTQDQMIVGAQLSLPLLHNKSSTPPPPCLDVLQACRGVWPKPTSGRLAGEIDLESPTSSLNFSENTVPITSIGVINDDSEMCQQVAGAEGERLEWKCFGKPMQALDAKDHRMDDLPGFSADTMLFGGEATWLPETSSIKSGSSGGSGFTEMLLGNSDEQNSFDRVGDSENAEGDSCVEGGDVDVEQENDYWNSLLDLVNSSTPSSSPPTMI